jgi:serine/threonine protein phosphatase PrpC
VQAAPTLTDVEPSSSVLKTASLVDAAGLTDVGRQRTTNEDSYLIATLQRSLVVHDASPAARGWFAGEPAGTLLVVADGMGGMGGGDVASRVAVNTVSNYLLNCMPWVAARGSGDGRDSVPGVRDQLSSALVAGDSTVKRAGAKSGAPQMGTTLTMALVVWPVLYVAHVGDTRCYLQRAGKLRRLTTDHTMAQQVEEMSHEPLDATSHLHHILWNALGATEDLPKPEIKRLELLAGDALVLCSDGLTKHVSDDEIARTLAEVSAPVACCQQLVARANAEGGTDNVTVVIARMPEPASGRVTRPIA